MTIPAIINDYELLVEFLELANELGGQVVIEGDSLPLELIAEAIASANTPDGEATP